MSKKELTPMMDGPGFYEPDVAISKTVGPILSGLGLVLKALHANNLIICGMAFTPTHEKAAHVTMKVANLQGICGYLWYTLFGLEDMDEAQAQRIGKKAAETLGKYEAEAPIQ